MIFHIFENVVFSKVAVNIVGRRNVLSFAKNIPGCQKKDPWVRSPPHLFLDKKNTIFSRPDARPDAGFSFVPIKIF